MVGPLAFRFKHFTGCLASPRLSSFYLKLAVGHMFVCLYVQPTNGTPAIGSRTRATLANKWIARRPRFSAHSDYKRSKDLHARPDQIHPDR